MLNSLLTWVDDAQPGDIGPVKRARCRVQHLSSLLQLVVGGFYVALFAWLGLYGSALGLLPLIVTSPVALMLLSRRGRPVLGGQVISLAALVFITGCLVARGGMYSNAAAWLLLSPMVGTFMTGPRHGIFVSGMVCAVFVATWSVEMAGVPMPVGLPDVLLRWMPLIDYPVIAMVMGGLVWAQAGIWERAERDANDAAKARYTFLATMSHEIRTPLNGVLGLTEVLLDSTLDEEQRQLATTIQGSGQLLRSLLDDVLDYAKIDSGYQELEVVPVDLVALCDQVAKLWQGPAHERQVAIDTVFDDGTPAWIEGDPTKLRQIVGNLVSNAVKFTEHGHVRILVSTDVERLLISVADTGVGMERHVYDRIFEAFRQADASTTREHGGTGLGLAISRQLARLMHGELSVRSERGVGSTFTLDIPLCVVKAPKIMVVAYDELERLRGLDVLVAEDNLVNQMVIRRLLERQGVRVRVTNDGRACVQSFLDHAPDLILMDCQMPVCDGYQAARRIRELGGELPIVALTANSMPGDRARCLEAGMDDHLGKPIDRSALLLALSEWTRPSGAL